MPTSYQSSIRSVKLHGRTYSTTYDFELWLKSTHVDGPEDFVALRKALRTVTNVGKFCIEIRNGRTYVIPDSGELVLVLTDKSLDVFLKDLDRLCKLIE